MNLCVLQISSTRDWVNFAADAMASVVLYVYKPSLALDLRKFTILFSCARRTMAFQHAPVAPISSAPTKVAARLFSVRILTKPSGDVELLNVLPFMHLSWPHACSKEYFHAGEFEEGPLNFLLEVHVNEHWHVIYRIKNDF